MKILKIIDQFNLNKTWIIRYYPCCGNYYVAQEIDGILYHLRFQRMTKKYLLNIGLPIDLGGLTR